MRNFPRTDCPSDDFPSTADDAFLTIWLANRDELCPLCQYNLSGLTTPRCPECGQGLRLSVALVEPYLKMWIAVIAGLLPPAGVGVIFFLAMVEKGFPGGQVDVGAAFAVIYSIACIPLSAAALILRRQFLQMNRMAQQAIAFTIWAAMLGEFLYVLSQMH